MSDYTITNRWTGGTLYVAKGAADVRAALQEAVAKRANLYGANLSSANLSSANLYGANLYGANLSSANLYGADLSSADLYGANLYGANLRGANLYGANLYGADLRGANLRSANLYGANLYGANLYGARGINPYLASPLHMLVDQPGRVRAYKLVAADGGSPIQRSGRIFYEMDGTYEVPDANTDPAFDCAPGINVASLDWCMRWWQPGYRILLVEFKAKDIAVIPTATDGKFRVRKVKVVGEKDLTELGLVDTTEAVA